MGNRASAAPGLPAAEAAEEQPKKSRRLDFILRLLALFLTLTAALAMRYASETNISESFGSLTGEMTSYSISVKSTDSSIFVYFVVANASACLYSAISAAVLRLTSPSRAGLRLSLAVGDLVASGVLWTSNAAAAAIEVVAWKGNSHFGWNKISSLAGNFCTVVTAANAISLVAAACYFFIVALSMAVLHRRASN